MRAEHDIRNFPDRVHILKAIHQGIDQANSLSPDKPPVEKAPSTKLFGSGPLDSLGIIHLVESIEQYIMRELGIEIMIVSDLFEIDEHPLETVQSLADHVERLVVKKRMDMQRRD